MERTMVFGNSEAGLIKRAKALCELHEAAAIRLMCYAQKKQWHLEMGWNDPSWEHNDEIRANWRPLSIGRTPSEAIADVEKRTPAEVQEHRIGAVAFLAGTDS